MGNPRERASRIGRRAFVRASAAMAGAVMPSFACSTESGESLRKSLSNAIAIGKQFVQWQSSSGGPDPDKCPYRSRKKFNPGSLQGVGPATRALYRLHAETGDAEYKVAADRYAVFMMSTIHEPLTPYTNLMRLDGEQRHLMSAAWLYGKALSPCYEWFARHNPREDALELRAHAFYRALERHRRDDSYYGVGYPSGQHADAQFSCDLGEVGTGLVGFFNTSGHKPALNNALGLARFFLTDYREGIGQGVWSPKLGVWLVGPWPGGGAEHFTEQVYNQTGWGFSCLVVGEFLLGLRRHVNDAGMRQSIDQKCVASLRWCLDACQFDDGAHGMFARDDKWLGMTAVPILLYARLREQKAVPADFEQEYRVKIDKAWRWLLQHTAPQHFPRDGYVKVTGKTSKEPPENLLWLLAWTVEALLDGSRLWSG